MAYFSKLKCNALYVGSSSGIATERITTDTLSAGSSGNVGAINIYPTTADKGYVSLGCADQDGNTAISVSFLAAGAARTINVPDAGATSYVMLTTAANDQDPVDATNAEINAVCDISAKKVSQVAGNFTLAAATHGNKITVVNDADAVITLPAATGTGMVYTLVVGATDFTGALVSVTGNDTMNGVIHGRDTDSEAVYQWHAVVADNEVNMSGTATGGITGDYLIFTDILTDVWAVTGMLSQSGGSEVTPFDAA